MFVLRDRCTFSLRSGEIVRTMGWSAQDVLWRTILRTRLCSRNFGGRPDGPGSEWRPGREGAADRKRRGRAVQHVARQLGVTYPAKTQFTQIARRYWLNPPQNVYTVLSAQQETLVFH